MKKLFSPEEDSTPKKSRISPALSRIAERGLTASEEDIRAFIPGQTDLAIGQAMLAGAITFKEIAEMIGVSPAAVSQHLQDPVMCAWTARHVHSQIHQKLGLLDAAMFRRALGGCVRAYEALMKRYGQAADLKLNVHVGAENFDLMSDEALDALLARRTAQVIDVTRKEAPSAERQEAEKEEGKVDRGGAGGETSLPGDEQAPVEEKS